MHSIFTQAKIGIVNGRAIHFLVSIYGLSAIGAVLEYYKNNSIFKMSDAASENDINQVTKSAIHIMLFEIAIFVLGIIIECIKKYPLIGRIKRYLTSHYYQMLKEADPQWLDSRVTSEDASAINSGVMAICTLVLESIILVKPLQDSTIAIISITKRVGHKGLFAFGPTTALFMIGMAFIRRNYKVRSRVKKQTNPVSAYITNIAETFFVHMLNGNGEEISNEIIESEMLIFEKTKSYKCQMEIIFGILQSIQSIFTFFMIWYLIQLIDDSLFAIMAILMMITTACNRMWWLFFTTSFIVEQVSEYSSLKQFLLDYKKGINAKKSEFDIENLYKELETSNKAKRIRLIGQSGCGKSTFMKSLITRLYERYRVDWIYLHQNMDIPRSKFISVANFLLKDNDKEIMIEYAKRLGIAKIIVKENGEMFDSFIKPSGGEIKRILILKAILPILCGKFTPKVIFDDEVTAGLDDNNWQIVQDIFKEIQTKYGVVFVSIDHHDLAADHVIPISYVPTPPASEDENENEGGFLTWIRAIFSKHKVLEEEMV